jgi:hypothetical protein
VSDIAVSGDGRWLLYLGGDGGQEWWRLRLDIPSQPELLHRLGDDLTADKGAIDPSGRAVIAVHRRTGDLWLARPPAGARW